MKLRRLHHPIWAHAPAALTVAGMICGVPLIIRSPGRGASLFDHALGLAIWIGLSLLFVGLSVFIDELWARQESRKTFNWMSLFDETTVGLLGGIELGQIRMLAAGEQTLRFPWIEALGVTLLVTALALALEILRPCRPPDLPPVPEDTGEFESELAKHLKSGQRLAYWDIQNPAWMTALIGGTALVLLIEGTLLWRIIPWLSVVLLPAGVFILLLYGGLRTLVTREGVIVYLGVFGIRLLFLNVSDISDARLHAFSPLRDFGGYGIRFNREMKAYFMRGNTGVRLTTSRGKKLLIGSDRPRRLLAVIRAVMAISGGT